MLTNTVSGAYVIARRPDVLVFSSWSIFAQDTWKVTRTLTITYGLRWEYNAAPSSPNNTLPTTVTGWREQPGNQLTANHASAPLWKAQKDDFAPRLGLAWQPFSNWVFRMGAGFFYDLGYSDVADGASAFPYAQQKVGSPIPHSR